MYEDTELHGVRAGSSRCRYAHGSPTFSTDNFGHFVYTVMRTLPSWSAQQPKCTRYQRGLEQVPDQPSCLYNLALGLEKVMTQTFSAARIPTRLSNQMTLSSVSVLCDRKKNVFFFTEDSQCSSWEFG